MKLKFFSAAVLLISALAGANFANTSERRVVTSDGVGLYVKISGSGAPCLFVHGGPGQGIASFEQMGGSNLEKRLTMIYLDQRGSGKSGSAADYSLARMVEDIEETRKALKLKKVNLLAHSFGGIIAVNYAKKYPERVDKLIMANATVHFLDSESMKELIRFIGQLTGRDFPIPEGADRAEIRKIADEARSYLYRKTDQGYRILTQKVETIQKMNSIDRDAARNRGFGRATYDEEKFAEYYQDHAPLTVSVKNPTLVITSAADYAIGVNHYKTFRFPNQTIKIFPGGHVSYYDENDLFVKTVADFIDGKMLNE